MVDRTSELDGNIKLDSDLENDAQFRPESAASTNISTSNNNALQSRPGEELSTLDEPVSETIVSFLTITHLY